MQDSSRRAPGLLHSLEETQGSMSSRVRRAARGSNGRCSCSYADEALSMTVSEWTSLGPIPPHKVEMLT